MALLTGTASGQPAPKFRLGDDVAPARYAVQLKLSPGEEAFSGSIDIELAVHRPVSTVWLNAANLTVDSAEIRAGDQSVRARAVDGGKQMIGITVDRPIPAGSASLHINYRGKVSSTNSEGLFSNREGGDTYIFSQFEPLAARLAFPCFDEPQFKVSWQLTLDVPAGDRAFANTPVVSETPQGGRKVVKFAASKPLPSYLVALAVGPLETVDAGKAGKRHVPVRIVVPRNRRGDARYAAAVTAELLTRLENYFGVPYPYEKLDQVAVPLVFGFGAMENAGMITYAQNLILAKTGEEIADFQRTYALVAAHEMAHQWFGDLVTLAWWNDTWLNEAFATWMEQKIVSEWKPEWRMDVTRVFDTQQAMHADSLISARRIRQPIESEDDIANAFDAITYQKGAAVIHMFEAWTGAEKFRKGVRFYLRRHAFGNATADEFLKDISSGSGRDIAAAFSTFLDQAGVPLVNVKLACTTGDRPKVVLTERRYLPLGSAGSNDQAWQIPVCVEYGSGGKRSRQCTLLRGGSGEIELRTRSCPEWVQGNAEQTGYYRVFYQDDLLKRLADSGAARLSVGERVGLLDDVEALVAGGEIPADEAMRLAEKFSSDRDRHVVSRSIDLVAELGEHQVPENLRPVYARFIRDTYGERARALGWAPQPGEDDDTRLLRKALVRFVARRGQDKALAQQAVELAQRWLKDRKAVAPDMVSAVLTTAAQYGDADLFDRFVSAAKASKDSLERLRLLAALGSFQDPALAKKAMELLLSRDFDARETFDILFGPEQYSETRMLPFTFVREHFDQLIAKLPRSIGADAGASLPHVADEFCSQDLYDEVERFFMPHIGEFTGGPRNLAKVLESIHLCAAQRKAQEPNLIAFLNDYQRNVINQSHSAAPRSSTNATSRSSR